MSFVKAMPFILSLASLQAVSASPVAGAHQVPSIVPGPGMPSLGELGLTVTELNDMPLPKRSLAERGQVNFDCKYRDDAAYTMAQDLKLCYNYLMSLPKGTMCGAGERSIAQFAVCGGAQAVGASNTGKATQSLCSDVAAPLLDIITKCPPRSDGKIAGHGVANGNGDLVVAGVGREYKWGWGFPALPEARSVPETRDTIVHRSPVVPGPGMPSLADLNLTTAELYDMPMLKLAIRDVDIKNMKINSMKPRCFDGPGVATSTDELRACYNYLKALPPTQICPLTAGENTEYVQNGNSHVIGLGNVFMKTTSSLCSDVAAAVLAVIEQCPSRFAGMAAGEREVTGNPEFLVLAISKDKKM